MTAPGPADVTTRRLEGKVVLISGSTGIAAATAEAAARQGARVASVSLSAADGEALLERLRPLGEALHVTGDLTAPAVADEAVARAVARFGRIDGLFNVAGASGRRHGDGPAHECTDAGWDFTLATNARSTFLLCRAALRRMLDQAPAASGLRGAILNMASVLALDPEPRGFATHAYAASKGGIIGMSRAMAAYYAPRKIRVNALAPALVRTPMSRRADEDPDIRARMKTKQPLVEDLLPAEDVAAAALFLLSDEARTITGETLVVDGGWRVS
jgi:NAD(P)-dependent dehydrogenase (short-subunit alcohol dehydrogenase family)